MFLFIVFMFFYDHLLKIQMENIRWNVSEVQSELSSVDFSYYTEVLNVKLNIDLPQSLD